MSEIEHLRISGKFERNLNFYLIGPTLVCMIFAGIVYRFQYFLPPLLNSFELCAKEWLIDISASVFPKVETHCYMLNSFKFRLHPSADVLVFFDIYIAICCLYSLIVASILLRKSSKQNISRIRRNLQKHSRLSVLSFASLLFMLSIGTIYFSFLYPDLIFPGDGIFHNLLALFSTDWGFGPAVQTGFGMSSGIFFLIGAVVIRAYCSTTEF